LDIVKTAIYLKLGCKINNVIYKQFRQSERNLRIRMENGLSRTMQIKGTYTYGCRLYSVMFCSTKGKKYQEKIKLYISKEKCIHYLKSWCSIHKYLDFPKLIIYKEY
jgi:hypothetical protein